MSFTAAQHSIKSPLAIHYTISHTFSVILDHIKLVFSATAQKTKLSACLSHTFQKFPNRSPIACILILHYSRTRDIFKKHLKSDNFSDFLTMVCVGIYPATGFLHVGL